VHRLGRIDDNRPLGYSGAQSAAAYLDRVHEKATGLIPLRPKPFEVPEDIVEVEIDPITGMLATSRCLDRRTELFIRGTEPTLPCTGNNYESLFRNVYRLNSRPSRTARLATAAALPIACLFRSTARFRRKTP